MSALIYQLDHKQPVQVNEFCESLAAFADEYRRVNADNEDGSQLDLYISEIRRGSIMATLVQLAPFAIVASEHVNTISDFIGNFSTAVAWLRERVGPKPAFKAEQLESIAKMMKPIASDTAANLTIKGDIHFHGDVNITINNSQAQSVRNAAQVELQEMGRARFDLKEKVILRWYQARYDPKSKSGDRSIIDAVFPKSVKTVFVNEGVKAKMLAGDSNPFRSQYIVDVMVDLVSQTPTKYRILDCFGRVQPA